MNVPFIGPRTVSISNSVLGSGIARSRVDEPVYRLLPVYVTHCPSFIFGRSVSRGGCAFSLVSVDSSCSWSSVEG